jgi:riboflavin synthase
MFSGITKGLYPVRAVTSDHGGVHYQVALSMDLCAGLAAGDSVAIDGVCQTVVSIHEHLVSFDAMAATCAITTLGDLVVGDHVSVERSMRWGDECGGHALSGHVRGTAKVQECVPESNQVRLVLRCPGDWLPFIFPKGYIAVNGSSLTVHSVSDDGCITVYLIPETCRVTALGQLSIGTQVNIELDQQTVTTVMAVERYLSQQQKQS